jgi:Zinc binding domain
VNCCDPKSTSEGASEQCPSCGSLGTRVDPITLKALLTSDALRRDIPGTPRFCATESCPVVYFDREACVTISERELTVRVHAKHPRDGRVPVCYCFDYSPSTIAQEIVRNGSSSARATIMREVQAGHCECEVRNPKGVCCLGDVTRVEQRLHELTHAEG